MFFISQNKCVQIHAFELTQSDGTHFVKELVYIREEVWGQGTLQRIQICEKIINLREILAAQLLQTNFISTWHAKSLLPYLICLLRAPLHPSYCSVHTAVKPWAMLLILLSTHLCQTMSHVGASYVWVSSLYF